MNLVGENSWVITSSNIGGVVSIVSTLLMKLRENIEGVRKRLVPWTVSQLVRISSYDITKESKNVNRENYNDN